VNLVRALVGVALIVVGGLYPTWAMRRLNRRLGHADAPRGAHLAWILVFTLTFSFALALTGAALLARGLGASPAFRGVLVGLWIITLVAGVIDWRKWRQTGKVSDE